MEKLKNSFIILLSMLLLTGCWGRTEINDLAFVYATGFDQLEDNTFRIAMQIPLPSSMGGQSGGGGGTGGDNPFFVDSGIGRNIREATDDLQERLSRELYFAHRRVLIIGKGLAKNGFQRSLDVIFEQPESRISALIVIANGEAMDIVNASPHLEMVPGEAIREQSKKGYNVDVRDVLSNIEKPGKDPIIPIVEAVKTKNNGNDVREEFLMNKVGILKDDKLMFVTDRKETLGLSWLLNDKLMIGKTFTVPIDEKSEINVKVNEYKVKTSHSIKDNLPEFKILHHVKLVLLQNEPRLDLEESKVYKMAIRKIEKEIQDQIESIIHHSKEVGADPMGLGLRIHQFDDRIWQTELKDKWREVIKDITVSVKVEAEIERINNKGIEIRED